MLFLDSVRSFVQSPTELKVKQATDESEVSGATFTLMNEISVLTYSPKTLKEIVQVLKKRLAGYSRKNSHKNCIHILKTLTLVTYLMNNGSNDFIEWAKVNSLLFECLKNFEVEASEDEKLGEQIRLLCRSLCQLIDDDELLEQRRRDVIQFRSSISSPGRKSTDNSHLRPLQPQPRGPMTRNWKPFNIVRKQQVDGGGSADFATRSVSTPETIDEYKFTYNSTTKYRGGTTSLELKRRRNTHEFSPFLMDPVTEEENVATAAAAATADGANTTAQPNPFSATNPFL